MSNAMIQEEIKAIISKILEVGEDKILPESNLTNDLGADSMQALEIMVALDKKYGVNINEADLPKMTTLKSISEIVAGLLNAK